MISNSRIQTHGSRLVIQLKIAISRYEEKIHEHRRTSKSHTPKQTYKFEFEFKKEKGKEKKKERERENAEPYNVKPQHTE